MAESLIVEPINFNVICILLDYNFRQVLIRITFKLYQLNAELKLPKGHLVFMLGLNTFQAMLMENFISVQTSHCQNLTRL